MSPRTMYPPMNRDELVKLVKELIREAGLRPRKTLGQHFTIDPRLIEEIKNLALSFKCSDQLVVEIGSGFGFLTAPLSRTCGRIISIELDRRLYNLAKHFISSCCRNVELVLGDALSILENIDKYQGVIGSIPYSITGPLLSIIARGSAEWAILVLQKDVIDRISSPPGTREYGSISVLVNLTFKVRKGNIYPPHSFYPEPEVFSQTVILERKKESIAVDKDLERFLKCLFSQRRRLVHKAVKICTGIEIPSIKTRVFQMTPEEIYSLYQRSASEKATLLSPDGY
ncbi:MAG: rRNA adenine dimethyltransferase family protein [Desulfurococcales archaeon]|nr:rRNA adenine dimethyltransferase family protein [Desulfurococcales archaeon]